MSTATLAVPRGTTRHTWRGIPVPYIALWSAEAPPKDDLEMYGSSAGLHYRDTRLPGRDSRGVLWLHQPIGPGQGDAILGGVHVGRQRQVVRQRRCQVCGNSAGDDALWVVGTEAGQLRAPDDIGYLTVANPLVCPPCYRMARELCPYMLGGHLAVHAASEQQCGVGGQVFVPDADSSGLWLKNGQQHMDYGDPNIKWMVAGQLLTRLRGITVVDTVPVPVGGAR